MIKAIFFDVGGVLIRDVGTKASVRAAKILNVPHKELRRDFLFYVKRVSSGRLSEREFWRILAKKYCGNQEKIERLLLIFKFRKIKVKSRVLSIAQRLRKNGYLTGILSDVIPTHARILRRFGIYRNFSPVQLSYETGVRKQHKKAFLIAARRAGVKSHEMVFLDDHELHVATARKLGIKAFVYRNPQQLLRSLRKFGVKI